MPTTSVFLADRVIRRFLLDRIEDGDTVLDVGCGDGWATFLIARERPGCTVHGTDTDARAVRAVHRRRQRARRWSTVRCSRCAAEDLVWTFGRGRYDVALSVHSLHHARDPFRALRNMGGIVRPGGIVLLAEYVPAYGEHFDDCPRFSLAKICALCEESGLRLTAAEEKRPGVLLVASERVPRAAGGRGGYRVPPA